MPYIRILPPVPKTIHPTKRVRIGLETIEFDEFFVPLVVAAQNTQKVSVSSCNAQLRRFDLALRDKKDAFEVTADLLPTLQSLADSNTVFNGAGGVIFADYIEELMSPSDTYDKAVAKNPPKLTLVTNGAADTPSSLGTSGPPGTPLHD